MQGVPFQAPTPLRAAPRHAPRVSVSSRVASPVPPSEGRLVRDRPAWGQKPRLSSWPAARICDTPSSPPSPGTWQRPCAPCPAPSQPRVLGELRTVFSRLSRLCSKSSPLPPDVCRHQPRGPGVLQMNPGASRWPGPLPAVRWVRPGSDAPLSPQFPGVSPVPVLL